MLDKEFWEKRHGDSVGRFHRVTEFSRFCYYNFMKEKKGRILDLCCGKGADSIFFHNKGFDVTSLDYSGEAIKQFNDTQKRYDIFLSAIVRDITQELPFEDDSFDFVYVRLGLHYFTDKEVKKIITEIKRVLKSSGLFMFQVKSTSDKAYGIGKKLEKDMYQEESGYLRHFYSKEYAESLLGDFNIILNEERKIPNGSAYLEVIADKK